MRDPRPETTVFHATFAVLGVAFLAIFGSVFLQEYLAEWRTTQAEFRDLEHDLKDPHALSLAPAVDGIRQIWLTDIDRVDRCTTCHLGVDDPTFATAPVPFATHSGTWLETHPPDQFGCTVCHGGQGEATSYDEAAHGPIPHWPEPMRSGALIEANCGVCHRERAPAQAFRLAAGRTLIADAGCVACHDMPGFSRDEVRAPRLDSLGYKVRADWLRAWLTDPEAYLSQARMPNFRLRPDEVESLTAFLLAQRDTPPLDSSAIDWSRADPDRGRTLFREARCSSCHAVDGRGGTMGPALSMIGSKVQRPWLFSFLKHPGHDQPETRMVRYRFSDAEVGDLVSYLMEDLIDPSAPAAPPAVGYVDPDQVTLGRKTFVVHGCYSCHPLVGMTEAGPVGPDLAGIGDRWIEASDFLEHAVVPSLPNWLYRKLREPDALVAESLMPTYGFTELETATAVVALLSMREADLPASRVTDQPQPAAFEPQGSFGALTARYQCLACHEVRGQGSELSTVPLDWIGSQLQYPYLLSYLQRPFAVRVSVEERMPHFHMTPEEARTIADYLSKVFVDDSLEPVPGGDPDAAARGEQLYRILGCRACHILGQSGGYVGPDLSYTGRRLKPGWIEAWLADPQKWKPGTLQPDYGLSGQEVRSLTAYLMTLAADPPGQLP